MKSRKVYYVRYRYSHHSPHSGYSRITEYAEKLLNCCVISVDKPLSRRIVRERMLWKLAEGTPGYTRAAMAAELKVAAQIVREPGCIYHFLYGETNYHYAGYLNELRDSRILATFHQPPIGIQKSVNIDWHLKRLSAIICVGRNQIDYLSKSVDRKKIHFIPLGLDIEYYQPPESIDDRDPDLCIIVGQNYRDFPTLRGVIELVTYLRPQTKFICVMSKNAVDRLGRHPNLELRSGIPEDELLDLYQTASLMVMPMTDATANNALLESMACSLPAVLSDVGAVRDYVTPEGSALVPPFDARTMAEKVIELLDNPEIRARLGEQARIQSLNFAWSKILELHKSVYDSLS